MEKKKLIIFPVLIYLMIGVAWLSGCMDSSKESDVVSNGVSGINIVNYTVVTHWFVTDPQRIDYYENGFYKEIPSDIEDLTSEYIINGTAVNNAGKNVDFYIVPKFYDYSGNYLFSGIYQSFSTSASQSKDFQFHIAESSYDDFHYVNSLKFFIANNVSNL